jgi:hypothetical protein
MALTVQRYSQWGIRARAPQGPTDVRPLVMDIDTRDSVGVLSNGKATS